MGSMMLAGTLLLLAGTDRAVVGLSQCEPYLETGVS